jgi:CRISPR-associated endonuclease Cas2
MSLLVAFDIADDSRRYHAVRILLDYGQRVQESVFWMDIDEELRGRMESRLRRALDSRMDILWVVNVCSRCASLMTLIGPTRKPVPPPYWIV